MSASIAADGVGVRFLFDREQRTVTPRIARVRRGVTEMWGLRDVSFRIGPGEAVALIGPSGAGKSTLLRTIAGVFTPDAGGLTVDGRIGSLLSIDAGLMTTLSGRENADLLGVLAGLERARSRDLVDDPEADIAQSPQRGQAARTRAMRSVTVRCSRSKRKRTPAPRRDRRAHSTTFAK